MRANFQKNYLTRYAILSGVCLLLAAWFGYDAVIGYPSKMPATRAYDEIRDLDAESRIEQWKTLTKENNWDTDPPDKTEEELSGSIKEQYFLAVLSLIGGLIGLTFYFRCKGTYVEPTAGGLATSWGQSMQFADVTQLNKRRWKKKGIAYATYTENGQSKKFTFDDFKFEREPLGKMLMELESVLDREKIVGGPTELETQDAREAKEAAAANAERDELEDGSADDGGSDSEQVQN